MKKIVLALAILCFTSALYAESRSKRTNEEKTYSTTSTSVKKEKQSSGLYRRIIDDFYGYSGKYFYSVVDLNYTRDCHYDENLFSFGFVDCRVGLVGFSILNFECRFRPNPEQKFQMAYKPIIKGYLPVCPLLALTAYCGASIDITKGKEGFNKHYEYPKESFHGSMIFGVSVCLTAPKYAPVDIFAEYRVACNPKAVDPEYWRNQQKGFMFGIQVGLGLK